MIPGPAKSSVAAALNTLVGGLVERTKIPDDIIVNAVLNLLNY